MISLEDSGYWYPRTRRRLQEARLTNVDLRLRRLEDFPREVSSLPDGGFDLVVVDFLEAPSLTRIDCIRPARSKVRPGGYLLLDDSDRPGYAEAFELLVDGASGSSAESRTSGRRPARQAYSAGRAIRTQIEGPRRRGPSLASL